MTSSPTIGQAFWKKPAENPSGLGALLLFIPKIGQCIHVDTLFLCSYIQYFQE
jgi:hypothetical protein